MIVLKKLELKILGEDKTIYFGQPESDQEKEEMFRLRFKIYSERGYIDGSRYPDGLEIDEYDRDNNCLYFLAKLDDKVIGTIRFIKSEPLPTEKDFEFQEPEEVKRIPRENWGELGRFIIIPPDKEKKTYLPRGLVMILMINTLADYGLKHGVIGGYFFIKKSLEKKMGKLGFPTHLIDNYKLKVERDDALYQYFNQVENPVIPGYFITTEYKECLEKILNNHWILSKKQDDCLVLNNNLYTKFLRKCNIM